MTKTSLVFCSTPPSALRTPQSRRGIAATELALFLPFIVFLFCVAVDFCRAYHAAQVIDSATRNAALYASGSAERNPDTATMEEAARQAALTEGATLSPPLRTQDVTFSSGADGMTVTISYRFEMLTSYAWFTDAVTINRSVTMAVAPRTPGAGVGQIIQKRGPSDDD